MGTAQSVDAAACGGEWVGGGRRNNDECVICGGSHEVGYDDTVLWDVKPCLWVFPNVTKHRAVFIFKNTQSKKDLTTYEDVGGMIIRSIWEHPATKRRIAESWNFRGYRCDSFAVGSFCYAAWRRIPKTDFHDAELSGFVKCGRYFRSRRTVMVVDCVWWSRLTWVNKHPDLILRHDCVPERVSVNEIKE